MKKVLILILVGMILTLSNGQTLFKNSYLKAQTVVNSYRFASQIPTDYVLAYYFNGNADDETDTYNGKVVGATLTSDRNSISNAAYSFGGSDYICNNNQVINLNNDYTICCWVNFSSLTGIQRIVSFSDSTTTKPIVSLLYNGAIIGQTLNDASGNNSVTGSTLSTGVWYFILIKREGTTFSFYVDDSFVGEVTLSNTFTGNNNITVGALKYNNSVIQFATADIDDIKVYNRALTTTEGTSLYDE